MSVDKCVRASNDCSSQDQTSAYNSVHTKGNVGRPRPTSAEHSVQEKVMQVGRPPHRLTFVYMLKAMWVVNG